MAKSNSSFDQFNAMVKEISAGNIKPVYLLHGEEYYFLERILMALENKVIEAATKDFNHHVFYGKETSVNDLLSTCKRFPMMAEKQLVVLKEAQHFKVNDQFIEYLENPQTTTTFVFYHPGKKLPMNRKPGVTFKKHALFTADPLKEKDLPDILVKYIQDKGYDIEPRSLHLLIEHSGAKLSVIVSELNKVFANIEPGNKIRENHIEEYVGINKEYNVFALQSALAKRQHPKAIEILKYMTAYMNANPLPMMVATLFSYFRKVAVLQSLKGKTDKEIMSILGIPFYFISDYRIAAKNYNMLQVQAVISLLDQCDLKFKGIMEHAGDDKSLLEETVMKIINC